ncbi:TetR/AcrR family transcriptional regulator [Streptomyces beijiangensis]|uniref:TetR/AcrR family transcriptional regulator n=1 Tax=Streptomyces beijiangensis TaxID=163361 RepID=A0A939JMK1_9ACTN|nr:TetR/AcrR family transcriptional regulator [Streptomyces beijiangensis]MBO0517535.1 TetR/AcrR family transcriptional regulator [Streptomyces beijiangensis]
MAGEQKKDGDRVELSLWERLERPAPAARTSLTPRKIAEVAVAIADAEGFAAVTMRRLAKELDVAPMAAYRHVSGKDDLWALMIDRIFTELGAAPEAKGWRGVLRAEALNVRELMLRHPWMGELPAPLFVLTPNRMAAAERQLAGLDGRGLDVDTMMVAMRTVNAYVYGITRSEVALHSYMKQHGWDNPDQTRTALAPQMMYLMGTGRYPTYHRYTREAEHKDDPSWEFELGLDCVLDGIEARLEPGS